MPAFLRGALALVLLASNTVLWCAPLFACALLKLLLPLAAVRRLVDPALNAFADAWVACNSAWMRLLLPTAWDLSLIHI